MSRSNHGRNKSGASKAKFRQDAIPIKGTNPINKAAMQKANMDVWQNQLTGLGVPNTDSMMSLYPSSPMLLKEDDYNNLYRGDGILRRINSQIVMDGTRSKYSYNGLEPDVEKKIHDRMKDLKFNLALRECWRWGRLHGGAVIFMGIDDGNPDLTVPLDITRPYDILFFKVFDRWRVLPIPEIEINPSNPNFGRIVKWRICPLTGGSFDVHESRLIIYDGEPLTDLQRIRQNWWGDSVVTAIYQDLRSLRNVLMNIDKIIETYVQPIMKIQGFAAKIEGGEQNEIMQRLQYMDLVRSTLRTIVLDSEEEYERVTSTIAGLEDAIVKYCEMLAGSTGYPMKILMGTSPKGLNATGETEMQQWYDIVKSEWESRIEPMIRRGTEVIAHEGKDGGDLPEYQIELNDLWQASDDTQAKTRLAHAQTDQVYLQNGVLTAEEIRRYRFEGPQYGNTISGLSQPSDEDLLPDDDQTARSEPSPYTVVSGVNPGDMGSSQGQTLPMGGGDNGAALMGSAGAIGIHG